MTRRGLLGAIAAAVVGRKVALDERLGLMRLRPNEEAERFHKSRGHHERAQTWLGRATVVGLRWETKS
jgi:hypothetical protein